MSNNYEKGKRFENQIVRFARNKGLLALRSSRSQSPIDIVIFNLKRKKGLMIQAKKLKFVRHKPSNEVIEKFKALSGHYHIIFDYIFSINQVKRLLK